MRRKPGSLLPVETALLGVLIGLPHREGIHGYGIAQALQDRDGARRLTAHGTLYKALDRLEVGHLVESRWEDPDAATAGRRPRRRLYRITGDGQRAYDRARLETAPGALGRTVEA
jgi:DNA-binding PadR family transcriptional regulator